MRSMGLRVLSLLAAGILVASFAAGCIDRGGPNVLIQETIRVGERFFDFGDTEFMEHGVDPELHARTVRANFTVPSTIETVGVGFQGSFAWMNSTATLTLKRGDGTRVMQLHAEPGLQDSMGTIGVIFQFDDTAAASPGLWEVAMEARGNVTTVDFSVHGIESEPASAERLFEIERRGTETSILLDARGWGRAPEIHLTHPDGSTTPLPLPGARGETTHTLTLAAGEHRLVLEPRGWGGVLIVQAKTT